MSYLSHLRKKPKHVRDNIAFVAAGLATVPVIAYLVFAAHGPNLSTMADVDPNEPKFFETFTSQIKEQMAAAREATSSTTKAANKYPGTVDRGQLDAVPVQSGGGQVVLIATTSATSSPADPR